MKGVYHTWKAGHFVAGLQQLDWSNPNGLPLPLYIARRGNRYHLARMPSQARLHNHPAQHRDLFPRLCYVVPMTSRLFSIHSHAQVFFSEYR